MAVYYKKYENKNTSSSTVGKWYGKAAIINEISTEDLAEEIAHSTTVTKADIVAVLAETAERLKTHLQNSAKVTLDGIGSFKVGLKTSPADSAGEFTANNITGYRINYEPEVYFTASGVNADGNRTGYFTKKLLSGISVKHYGEYSVE